MIMTSINYNLDFFFSDLFLNLLIITFFFYFILYFLFNVNYSQNKINTNTDKSKKKEDLPQKPIDKKKNKQEAKKNKKNENNDEYEMTKEQEQELWAETYYTKPKNSKKEKEPYKPWSQRTKKLMKIFYWFFFLNFITLIIIFISTFNIEPGLVNINLTTKAYYSTPEYTKNVIELSKYSLDDFNVSHLGKRFLESVKNMIDSETLTPSDIKIFIEQWQIREEGTLSKYKILWCLIEYFIDHYKESSIADRGDIRLIVKLCYAYCTELKLIHNQFDLIGLLRFMYIYKNHPK